MTDPTDLVTDRRDALAVIRESRTLAYALGGITLAAGLVLLFWPDRTIGVVARVAGLLMVIMGIGDLADAVRTHRTQPYWGLLAVRAIFHVAFGAVLLVWPGITITAMVWLVGLDQVLTGLLGFVVLGKLPPEYRPAMIMRSVLAIAFGGIILAWPHATLAVVALVIAALLIGFGLVLLWSGRQIGKLADAA